MKNLVLLGMALSIFISSQVKGMEFTSRKLHVWKRGETMAGDEFIAANEEVVDYLATLKRPSETFKSIAYQCEVKARDISPSIQNNNVGTNNNPSYVYLKSVYAIRNCVPIN